MITAIELMRPSVRVDSPWSERTHPARMKAGANTARGVPQRPIADVALGSCSPSPRTARQIAARIPAQRAQVPSRAPRTPEIRVPTMTGRVATRISLSIQILDASLDVSCCLTARASPAGDECPSQLLDGFLKTGARQVQALVRRLT